jgi:hypothetical protein
MHRAAAVAAISAALLVPAVAEARPAKRLPLKSAFKAAKKSAVSVKAIQGIEVDFFELNGCDRDGRRAADCEITYVLYDGAECYDVLHVSRTRRGKLVVASESGGRYECTTPEELEDEELLDDEFAGEGEDVFDDEGFEDEDFFGDEEEDFFR